MTARAALLLLADSRFPTGAHAHSGGLEASHGRGDVRSIDDLAAFVDGRLLTVGPLEAAFAAAACAGRHDLAQLDAELAARTPSLRLRTVSRTLGRQLLRAGARAWPAVDAGALRAVHPNGAMQPLVLGSLAATAGLAPAEAALCSLHHLVGAATTAAVRLMGLDPFAVNALAASLATRLDGLAAAAALAAQAPPSELPASSSLLADALAEHHATWEVRLFAS
jgi:urease accessory protein